MTSAHLADLATHQFVPLDEVSPGAAETFASEQSQQRDQQLLAITGADEAAELAARSSVGGRDVILLFRAVRYGDTWWLESLGGQFAALLGLSNADAGVVPVSSSTDEPAPSTTP